jgi:hypothetical protein
MFLLLHNKNIANLMTRLKTGFYVLSASLCLTGLFVSCLGGSDDYVYEISNDAQLVSFSLSHDSLPALATAKFSIDQAQGLIYNYDSLPYLTDTAKIASKAIVKYVAGSGAEPSLRIEHLTGDTAWVANGDTLRLAPRFSLKLYAPGGMSKTYEVRVGIHQIDPDVVQYLPVDGSEVPVTPAPDWATITQHCPPELEVVVCLGFLRPEVQRQLFLIVRDGTDLRFACSDDLRVYRLGDKVPADFPLAGFSTIHNRAFAGEMTIISGLQSVWMSNDGLYWSNIFDTTAPLPVIEGGNAFYYNDELWFMNGKIRDGEYNRKVYGSVNNGIVWTERTEKVQVPEAFPLRRDAQVVVDADGKYFYISGGRNENTPTLDDAWRAALNAKLFVR